MFTLLFGFTCYRILLDCWFTIKWFQLYSAISVLQHCIFHIFFISLDILVVECYELRSLVEFPVSNCKFLKQQAKFLRFIKILWDFFKNFLCFNHFFPLQINRLLQKCIRSKATYCLYELWLRNTMFCYVFNVYIGFDCIHST